MKGDRVEYFLYCTLKSGNVNPTQIKNNVASLLDQCMTDIPPSHMVWKK